MKMDPVIQELLVSAGPSIQYRLRAELLGQSRQDQELFALQEQILRDPLIRQVIAWQQPDGWLAWC